METGLQIRTWYTQVSDNRLIYRPFSNDLSDRGLHTYRDMIHRGMNAQAFSKPETGVPEGQLGARSTTLPTSRVCLPIPGAPEYT